MVEAPGRQLSVVGTAYLQYVRTFGTRGAYQFGSVNRAMVDAGTPWAKGVVRARTSWRAPNRSR